MSDNVINNENPMETPAETSAETTSVENPDVKKGGEFKFFKSCSASLKRFSVIIFIINLFLSITLIGVAVVVLGVYIGYEMLALLALPILTVAVILVVLSRFVSALVYGFAEIVEKHEKK